MNPSSISHKKQQTERFLSKVLIAVVGLGFFSQATKAADKYWAGGAGGNWDTSSLKWSTTSGGAAAVAFTSGDNAIFDQAGLYRITNSGTFSVGTVFIKNGVTVTNSQSSGAISAGAIDLRSGATLQGQWGNWVPNTPSVTIVTNDGTLYGAVAGAAAGHTIKLLGGGTVYGGPGRISSANFTGNMYDDGSARGGVLGNGGPVAGFFIFSGDSSQSSGDWLLANGAIVCVLNSANALGSSNFVRLEGASAGPTLIGLGAGNVTRVLAGNSTANGGINWQQANSGFFSTNSDNTLTFVLSLINNTPQTVTWGNNGITANPIQLGYAGANGKLIWNNNINLNGAARTINVVRGTGTADAELSGNLSGNVSSTLVKTGNGILNLAGFNTYAGGTTVSNGTLNVTSIGQLPDGNITVVSNASLNIYGNWAYASTNVTVNGTLDYSSASSGSTLSLAAGKTFSGSGVVTGSVNLASSAILTGSLTLVGSVDLASSAILTGTIKVVGSVNAQSGSSVIPGTAGTAATLIVSNDLTLSGQTLQFDLKNNTTEGSGTNDEIIVGGTLTAGGAIISINYLDGALAAGTYKLFKFGSLSGTFSLLTTYPNVTIDNGVGTPGYVTLVVSAPSVVGNLFWKGDGVGNLWDIGTTANWVTNFANAALDYSDPSQVTFDNRGSNNVPVVLNSTVLPTLVTFNITNKSYTLSGSGSISSVAAVIVNGGATLTNNLVNTYSGGTTLNNNSSLLLGDGASIGTGKVTMGNGTSKVTVNSSTAVTLPTLAGSGGTPQIIQNGAGVTSLMGATDDSFLGAVVNNGTLQLAVPSTSSIHALGISSTINAGAKLQLGGSGGDQLASGVTLTNIGGTIDTANLSEQFTTVTGYGGVIGGGTLSLSGALGLSAAGTLGVTNTTVTLTTASAQWLQNPGSVVFDGGTLNLPSIAYTGVGAAGNQNIYINCAVTTAGNGETIFGESGESSITTFGPSANASFWFLSYKDTYTNTFWYNGGNIAMNRLNYRGSNNGAAISSHYFNGTTFTAKASIGVFMNAGTGSNVKFYVSTNGLILNDAGFNVGVSAILAHDSSLGAGLDGGLTKSGSGVLTLSATNTFNGSVTLNNGTLVLNNVGSYNNVFSAENTTNQINVVQSGVSLTNSSLTLGNSGLGTKNLNFNLGTLGIPTQPVLQVNNVLTNTGNVVIYLTAPFLVPGTAPLIRYGSMDAANFAATWSVAAFPYVNLTLTNDTANKIISVIVEPGVTPKWKGNISSAWDTNTLNWTSNAISALYVETTPPGQPVTFDDTAVNFLVDISSNTVNPQFISMTNGTDYTLTGTLGYGGTGALIKNGAGSLVLSNASGANTYSGITTVSGGTLVTAQPNVLSPNSAMTLNSGALNIGTNNQTINAIIFNNSTLSGSGTLSGGSLTFNDGSSNLVLPPLAGALSLTQNGTGKIDMVNSNTMTGRIILNAGTLQVNNVGALGAGGFVDGTKTDIENGAALVFDGASGTSPELFQIRGSGPTGAGALVVTNGNVTINGGNIVQMVDNTTVNIGANASLTNLISFSGGFTLTKIGGGLLYFSAASNVNANEGTSIVSGSCGRVTVNSGGTFGGAGTASVVDVKSGGTLAPGNLGIGTMTVSSSLTNAGNTLMEISYDGVATNADRINVATNLVYGGTLTVTNVGPNPLAAGQTFKLFNAPSYTSGTFSSVTLPTLPGGLGWTNKLAINGTLTVVQTVSVTPFSLGFTNDGSSLTITWPSDHTGWRLQNQTNTLSTGLNPSVWFDVTGSTTTNEVVVPLNTANPAVFYRMIYP